MEKEFTQIQLGLFFQTDFTGQFENASLLIKEKFENASSQILGIPDGFPSDAPRLIIKSEKVNINLSKNRIDFFSKDKEFISNNIDSIFYIINKLSLKIGRIGIVLNYFQEIKIEDFKDIFTKEKISVIKNLTDVMVRLNEVTEVDGVKVNNSQIYASVIRAINGSTQKGFIITRDINTLIEETKINDFTQEKVLTFSKAAIEKTKDVIF